ncbi:MAG: anaerobic ribonucleoside triphosphate reductase [Syntrophus sp. PtaU1.Bin208]|nr:MAG: anaerobic ribonucleoside triphosphate reductase [Syntrophus sp. PtaU1.Bin208]
MKEFLKGGAGPLKKSETAGNRDTTDLTLFVRTSDEEIVRWNRQRIVDALIRETDIDGETAEAVSREVEKQLMNSGISLLTSTLIRELVDAKLIERGLEQARGKHARLGFPLYDVGRLILHPHRGNANLPHNPEATNLILAEGIKRAYGLHEVFSRDVGDAHAAGDLHIHALGYIDRPYSICSSLEYVKKFGMDLPHSVNVAGPARHGDVLLAHMVRYAAILQGHFSGVVAWHGVNYFFAPYLVGMTEETIRLSVMPVGTESSWCSRIKGSSLPIRTKPAKEECLMSVGSKGSETKMLDQSCAVLPPRMSASISSFLKGRKSVSGFLSCIFRIVYSSSPLRKNSAGIKPKPYRSACSLCMSFMRVSLPYIAYRKKYNINAVCFASLIGQYR